MTAPAKRPASGAFYSVDGIYNYGYLDEQSKRMVRRCILKAVAIPGYQVPFGSRDMPIARGWGTGGLQITLSIIGPQDVLKVIAVRAKFLLQHGYDASGDAHAPSCIYCESFHGVPVVGYFRL